MAPSVVGESLKGAELLAQVMQTELGYECFPPPASHRTDIIQAVKLGSRQKVPCLTIYFQQCLNVSVTLIVKLSTTKYALYMHMTFSSLKQLIAFCEAVQRRSPVGAHIRPTPGHTPGYGHEVIFAGKQSAFFVCFNDRHPIVLRVLTYAACDLVQTGPSPKAARWS